MGSIGRESVRLKTGVLDPFAAFATDKAGFVSDWVPKSGPNHLDADQTESINVPMVRMVMVV